MDKKIIVILRYFLFLLQLLIKAEMLKNKDFLCFQTFSCCINHASKY